MIFRLITFLTILIACSTNLFAYDLIGSVGNLSEHLSLVQTTEGSKSPLYLNPYFNIRSDIKIFESYENLALTPELGCTIPQSTPDNNTSRWKFYSLLNLKYNYEKLYSTMGIGLFVTNIWGNGGEEELNNGSSTTSFPLPDKKVYATNIIVALGIGKKFTNDLDLNLQSFLFNLENSEDRSLSIGLNIGYHFGEL